MSTMEVLAIPSHIRWPKLAKCLEHIERSPETFKANFHLLTDLQNDWNDQLKSKHDSDIADPFPELNEVWIEAVSEFPWPGEDWDEHADVRNIDQKYIAVIADVLREQPVYIDRPSNFNKNRFISTLGQASLPTLDDVLGPLLNDRTTALHAMDFFSPLIILVVDWFRMTEVYAPSDEFLALARECIVDHCSRRFSLPYDTIPVEIRRDLAKTNVSEVTDMFFQYAGMCVVMDHWSGLGWYMHSWFARRALALLPDGPIRQVIIEDLNSACFLPAYNIPIHNFCPPRYRYLHTNLDEDEELTAEDEELTAEDEELTVEYEVDDIEDVVFEPVGEPLNPLDYAEAITGRNPVSEEEICLICQDPLGGIDASGGRSAASFLIF
ncbi:hypothetical protein BDV95DRAFT_668184 [Massariosphaeria phaeospora]|uniref:Uncharacterized protein n=1 Tax=Massariosphaeria phaeospora TaxID=100035 RepID=A0A7C8I7W9_9PLEO|nr:hypothetical protein BDV95DRAFT_668184 [Massariosphaeria phaeospora]